MIETPQSILAADGTSALRALVAAGGGRVRGAHFGTYDYTALCGITASWQHMRHQACDFARHMMQVALAQSGVWLSDGATNVLPIPPDVHRAWKLHFDDIRHSLCNGFYQGWDLHPAQLPTRYAAVYAFFLSARPGGHCAPAQLRRQSGAGHAGRRRLRRCSDRTGTAELLRARVELGRADDGGSCGDRADRRTNCRTIVCEDPRGAQDAMTR